MEFIPMAMQAVGAIYSGYSEGSAADAEAANARSNASMTRMQTSAQEDMQRRQMRMRAGESRAAAVESGFDPNSGSLGAMQAKTAAEMELDVLTARYEGELQALSFDNEAASHKSRAKAARRQAWLNAAGTVFGSAGNYAGRPRMGPPAPVESRTPVPVRQYDGWR